MEMKRLTRRDLLVSTTAVVGGVLGDAFARPLETRRSISIGMSLPLTGPSASYGMALKEGASAALLAEQGIVADLKVLDDGGDPARAIANARELANDPTIISIVAGFGTECTAAMLPILEAASLPLVGCTSGAESLRAQPHRCLFHLRASYGDEAQAIVVQLDQLGMSDIGIVHQDDGLGLEGVEGAKTEMARLAWRPIIASMRSDGSDLKLAVQQVAAERPTAVLLIARDRLAAGAAHEFLRAGHKPLFMALAETGTPEFIELLGPLSRGFGLSQVLPHPWSGATKLARAYQAAMQRFPKAPLSYTGLEGYVCARTVLEGLRRVGREPSREKLISGLEAGPIDMGDFVLRFTPRERRGSRFTAMTVIGEKGRILR